MAYLLHQLSIQPCEGLSHDRVMVQKYTEALASSAVALVPPPPVSLFSPLSDLLVPLLSFSDITFHA